MTHTISSHIGGKEIKKNHWNKEGHDVENFINKNENEEKYENEEDGEKDSKIEEHGEEDEDKMMLSIIVVFIKMTSITMEII